MTGKEDFNLYGSSHNEQKNQFLDVQQPGNVLNIQLSGI